MRGFTELDREQEYRRQLLAAARSGKTAAQEELQREFNVRIYSAAERAKLDVPRLLAAAAARRGYELDRDYADSGD